jgi:hypothetical protein
MSGPRTQPITAGTPVHHVERGPQSVRHRERPAIHDIMRSKSDLHLYVREAHEFSAPAAARPSADLASADASAVDSPGGANRLPRHRFRLPPSIGRVFGGKRDPKRSASVSTISRSASTTLAVSAQYRPA